MSNDKSLLLANLKKTLAVGLPVMAISGFVPSALTVGAAQAESKAAVVAEAKSEAEGKYAKAKSEAEGKYAKAKSEGEAKAEGEAAKAEGEAAKAEGEAAKAEGEAKKLKKY